MDEKTGTAPTASTSKQALRAKMRAVRDSLGVDGRASADAAIAAKVCANSAYLAADAVFT